MSTEFLKPRTRIRLDSYLSETDAHKTVHNWKENFLGLSGHQVLCNIPNSYIEDQFNLYGLDDLYRYFKLSISILTGKTISSRLDSEEIDEALQNLPSLYCRIHARYVLSQDGFRQMKQKLDDGDYGFCPRALCNSMPTIPFGYNSEYGEEPLYRLCPCCMEVYRINSEVVLDGSYYGPNCAHIFMGEIGITHERHNYLPFQLKAFGFSVKVPHRVE